MNSLATSPWGFSPVASSLDKFEALPTSTSTPSCTGISYSNAFLIRSHSYGDEREQDGTLILTEMEKAGVEVDDKSGVLVFLIQNQFPLETVKEGFRAIRNEFQKEKLQLSIFIDPDTLRETLYFIVNIPSSTVESSVEKVTLATHQWLDNKPARYSDLLNIDLRIV